MITHPESRDNSRFSRRIALAAIAGTGGLIGLSRLIGVKAFASDDHDTDKIDTPEDGKVAPLGTVPPGSMEVRIVDDDANGFQPQTISVEPGQSVTFVNLDDDPHTATGAAFDTGIIQPGEQVTVTLDQAGVHPYACQIHPVMTGVVEVPGAVGTPEASPQASPVAAAPDTGDGASVSIIDFAFEPAELTVSAGSAVTWTNNGAAPHTATASDQSFDTSVLNPGDNASHTFTEPGEFAYFCAFHPSMTGTVIVT